MNICTHTYPPKPAHARRAPFSRTRLGRHGSLFALGAVAGFGLLGCSRGVSKAGAPVAPLVHVVKIDTAHPTWSSERNYTGVVRARFESNLSFRVAGKVVERLVNAGDAVKKGQPLLKLDPTDYQLALQAAQAIQEQASLELKRARVLVEKRAESHDVLERAAAAATSSAAQAKLAADQVGYTTLYADSNGVVTTTLADPGQVVAAGQPVAVFARDGAREAAVDIPEGSLEEIRQGEATARLYLNPAVTVPAKLREISGVADPVSRTYRARYVLEGDPAQFPLGATVTVCVAGPGDATRPMVEIPLGSLIDHGDGAAVWVVDPKTSTVHRRAVSIAKLGTETALVSRGLAHGDIVVALGAQLLNAGEAVRMETFSSKGAK
ncbi:efflux pump periplasmic linker BepF [mine drainage metagenome]|uniref:Efflux pump periplasmic linker BepF n=1 Tax=mine drainage metagenome TaxID=410659 RepID=A0A1J5RS20_9ZZZZ